MNTAARFWAPSFSPYRSFGAVPLADVADALRQQFLRWGMPHWLRVDNGIPWGNWSDLPAPFALWVLGLGIRLHWNDPYCPQQNPKIERSQGTGKRWAEPNRCQSVAELQRRLHQADLNHREHYRLRGGKSRLELFPALRHSERPYRRTWEANNWDLAHVVEHVSEYVVIRRVSSSGHVSVYDRSLYIGKQFAQQQVQVQLDPDGPTWLISDAQGRELRRHPALEISDAEIVKLTFRRKRSK